MKLNLLSLMLLSAMAFSCSADNDNETSYNDPDPIAQQAASGVVYDYGQDEQELAALINDYRQSIGLNGLQLANYISLSSQQHNLYMIQNNVVNHDQFQQRASDIEQNLGAQSVSENIAYNYQQASGAFEAWLGSTGHRAAIEGNFTDFGIAVTVNPDNGKKYYTVIFALIQ